MRIKNRGTPRRESDAGLHQGREQRARAFRSMHRVGQQVSGRFLKRDVSGLSWVSFDGLPLLTQLEAEPRPGAPLQFIVQALTPDIVLKECRGKGGRGGQGQTRAVVGFDTARTAFEDAARDNLLAQKHYPRDHGELNLLCRKNALLAQLDADQFALYARAALAQALVNHTLAQTGPTRLFYLPWLAPALKLDLIARSTTKDNGTSYHEVALGFDSPMFGPGQVRILSRPGLSGVRTFLEKPDKLPLAAAVLKALGSHLGAQVDFLTPARPPQYAQGGVLQQLLASDPHALIGLGG